MIVSSDFGRKRQKQYCGLLAAFLCPLIEINYSFKYLFQFTIHCIYFSFFGVKLQKVPQKEEAGSLVANSPRSTSGIYHGLGLLLHSCHLYYPNTVLPNIYHGNWVCLGCGGDQEIVSFIQPESTFLRHRGFNSINGPTGSCLHKDQWKAPYSSRLLGFRCGQWNRLTAGKRLSQLEQPTSQWILQ